MMHEFDADAAGINTASRIDTPRRRCPVQDGKRSEVAQGIEIGLQIAPAAERVQDGSSFSLSTPPLLGIVTVDKG